MPRLARFSPLAVVAAAVMAATTAAATTAAGTLGAQEPARPRPPADSSVRTPAVPGAPGRDSARAAAQAGTPPGDTTRPGTPAADPVDRLLRGMTPRHLGPFLFGGRITALAAPRPYRKTLYAGTAGGGVWKTTNGGVTWRAVSDSTGALTVGDLAVAPSDSNVLWVGTGEKNSLRSQGWGNGVWKSTNGGRTWTSAGLAETRTIGRVVVHPRDPNTVWVAALGHLWGTNPERGVYKTTDGGRTWSRVLFVNDTTGFVDLTMDPSNPDVLYAAGWHRLRLGGTRIQGVGAGSGIWKTTDGGRTWTRLTDAARRNGLPTDRMGRIGLAVSAKSPRTVYAMIQVDRGVTSAAVGPQGGVFKSTDAGATWAQVHDVQAVPHYFYNDIWADPSDAEHLWVSGTYLMESTDGGRTFAPSRCQRARRPPRLWINPDDPRHLILGNDGGVYESRDAGQAGSIHALPVAQAYTSRSTARWRRTPCARASRTTARGASPARRATRWASATTTGCRWAAATACGCRTPWHDPHTVYTELQYGAISRFDLRTGRRDPISPGHVDAGAESSFGLTWGWTTPLLLSQHDSTVLYAGANRLVKYTKRGDDWELLGPDMTRAARDNPEPERGSTSYHAIFSIAEGPRDRNLLWTGSDDGLLWVTRDGGRTWAETSKNLPAGVPQRCFVGTIVASRHAAGTAYAALDCHHRDDYRPISSPRATMARRGRRSAPRGCCPTPARTPSPSIR
jgi:photosystem II stability/assembly factor-like uncharacterized protein